MYKPVPPPPLYHIASEKEEEDMRYSELLEDNRYSASSIKSKVNWEDQEGSKEEQIEENNSSSLALAAPSGAVPLPSHSEEEKSTDPEVFEILGEEEESKTLNSHNQPPHLLHPLQAKHELEK